MTGSALSSTVLAMSMDRYRRESVLDVAAAVGLAALVSADSALAVGTGDATAAGSAALVAAALSLAVRRRYPRVVLGVAVGCLMASSVAAAPGLVGSVPVLVAIYTCVRVGYRGTAIAVMSPIVAGVLVTSVTDSSGQPVRDLIQAALLPVGWIVASGVLGEVMRQHHAYVEQVEERAREAERTREETALRRAGQERLRIARELHDSLTHAISVIKMQAGVAVHLAGKRGEPVPEALVAIQQASADANRELRQTLEMLRDDGDEVGPGGGVDGLESLVSRSLAAGVRAQVSVSGQRRRLPGLVDKTVYRIVQESLTNVARHSGGGSARVSVEYGDGDVVVCVDDDGEAAVGREVVPGVGLRGMRERVSALEGELVAQPRPGGGFRVRACLPLGDRA